MNFSNMKMMRANSSGSSNQTSDVPASLARESTEGNESGMSGQMVLCDFVIEELEETPAMDDVFDLVCNCSLSRYAVGFPLNDPGHVIRHDPARRIGPHSIS